MKIHEIISLLIFVLLSFTNVLHSQTVEGLWESYHDETGMPLSRVLITNHKEGIVGTVQNIFFQPWEGNNPKCYYCQGERHMQNVLGMDVLWDFSKDGSNWVGGKVLDPSNGKIYNGKIWLESDRKLKLRAYLPGVRFLNRTQNWELVKRRKTETGVLGIWNAIDDVSGLPSSRIELYIDENTLKGKVIEKYTQPWEGQDAICISCTGALKGENIVGMKILYNFELKDQMTNQEHWVNGKVMDPGNGKTYNSSIWLEDKNTLKLRGYWGPFHRTQTWKRVSAISKNIN